MSRCPHCPKTKTITNESGVSKEVSNTSAVIFTFVSIAYPYIEEPAIFHLDGIDHEHDPNPIAVTWRCRDGHEFVLHGKRPCNGCSMERQMNEQRIRDEANQATRMQNRSSGGSNGSDHHRMIDHMNRGPDLI